MALSLPGERSLAAASLSHPLAFFMSWIAKQNAARTRRRALQSLLDLDASRLYDLGITRHDITDAMAGANLPMALNGARARNARR